MTDIPIAELRRLLEETDAEAPTPWTVEHVHPGDPWDDHAFVPETLSTDAGDYDAMAPETAALIAAMRGALPALLDAAEERDRLREAQEELIRMYQSADSALTAARARLAALESAARELLEELQSLAEARDRVTCPGAYRGRSYASKNKARCAAWNVQHETGVRMEPYHCDGCGAAHVRPAATDTGGVE